MECNTRRTKNQSKGNVEGDAINYRIFWSMWPETRQYKGLEKEAR